eukprot:CAMPEP_0202964326 /NCGR_PEP_ID=MMETSP1396-20130829/8402_1 /ASSEMBLY_ACC=CAM_ASM_000872 /TAXON_ID= /ORGANISM="Pseudokeronopsis sp., Strain Brazil" /LENGTH=163 /DNA_ID=CAMNT_0049686341 /DNA_START=84 /DNA_END=575 /DNA_ORIENTATION=+
MSGLSAAHYLQEEGCTVKVLEARDRTGGRTYTYEMEVDDGGGPFYVPVDLGASWIHGIGKGVTGLRWGPIDFPGLWNPIYTIAEENGIEMVQADGDKEYYYSYNGGELVEPNIDIDELYDDLESYIYRKSFFAKKGVSVQDAIDKYKYKYAEADTIEIEFLLD